MKNITINTDLEINATEPGISFTIAYARLNSVEAGVFFDGLAHTVIFADADQILYRETFARLAEAMHTFATLIADEYPQYSGRAAA